MPADVISWGSLVLGVVVMYLAMMYITRQLKNNANATSGKLAKFLAILLAGTAVQFLASRIDADAAGFAWYAIGLGVGLALYTVLYAINNRNNSGGIFPTGVGRRVEP